MSDEVQVQITGPVIDAFDAYKLTTAYANTRYWSVLPEHVDGSLWAAFHQGWLAAQQEKSDNA